VTGVPRHLKNPRRWYDADGIEQPPATIANSMAHGARGLLVFCECGHSGAMSFDGLPDDLPVPDVALRLVCSACGRKDWISTRPDFAGVHTGAGPKLRSVE
jgi:hypothetical protein